MTQNTSPERVDRLLKESSDAYDTIDPIFDGEPRYRRMVRFGVNSTAIALRNGETIDAVGAHLLQLPHDLPAQSGPLDTLADAYADVRRATLDREGTLESDARHAMHLLKLSSPYAQEHYPKLNPNKIAAYALVHDIIEAYAGDVASLGMSAEQEAQKNADEAKALLTLQQEHGEAWPEFVELIESYEALNDPEARFTKTFDKLDPSFTQFYNNGSQLRDLYGFSKEGFLQAMGQTVKRMEAYAGDFPKVIQDREELTRRIADIAFKEAA